MFVKLQNYFFKRMLPEVVILKNDVCADNKQIYYCIRRRPCFEPMIACDARVNIKIAPKGSWFCKE